jgi:hypothetical protein
MSGQQKRKIAVYLLFIWAILFGICFSENFGLFNETFEKTDQTIENTFASDQLHERFQTSSGEQTDIGFPVKFQNAFEELGHLNAIPLALYVFVIFGSLKLFQFLSTYRI